MIKDLLKIKKLYFLVMLYYLVIPSVTNARLSDFFGGWGRSGEVLYSGYEFDQWVNLVREGADGSVVTNMSASDYIQRVVNYLLTFVTIIAVIIIMYAWFKVLTSAWDEEKASSAKKIIISVAVWILIMWLAYAIVKFIITALAQ